MSQQLKKKFLGDNQVDGEKLLLQDGQAVRAMDGVTEVELAKIASSEVYLNGFKVLESSGLIPSARLPAYVDDILEFADLAAFPASGETGKIYVALDTNKQYRWSGSTYVQITSGAVDSVNGETGVVTLDASDIQMVSEATSIESKLVSLQGEVDATEDDISHLVTLSGVAVDSDSLGSFTGTTIADNQTIKAALQDLETAVEAVSGGGSSTQLELDDTQVGAGLETDGSYVAPVGSNYLGSATSLKDADSKLDAAIAAVADDVSHLVTLSGVAVDSNNLGSFTGSTIADNQTVKAALQDLETAHEAHLNDVTDAHNASAISIVAISGVVASDVQVALEKIQENIVNEENARIGADLAIEDSISDHLNDATDAHDASAISFSPAGNIAAIEVQAAIEELDTEKVAKSGDTMSGLLDITVAGAVGLEVNDIIIGEPWGAGYSVISVKDGSADELYIQSADQLGAFAGNSSKIASLASGYTDGANSGSVTVYSGQVATSGNSGAVDIASGFSAQNSGMALVRSGDASGGNSGAVELKSGNASAASGSVTISSGTGASRGKVEIDASKLNMLTTIDMNSHQINELADGTLDSDAVNKGQLDDGLALKLDLAGGTMSGNILMGNNSITNLVMTMDPHSAATREYVDNVAEGLHIHAPVRAIRSTAIAGTYDNGVDGVGATFTPTSAVSNIDGLGSFAIGQRIILNAQANNWENGIYTVSAVDGSNHVTEFTRATDFDTPAEVAGGDFVFVQSGSTYANTGWVETKTTTVPGFGVSDEIAFLQFSGAGSYTAGDGLDLTGTIFSVNVSELVGDGIQDDGSNNFAVKVSDFAGDGLEDDGSNNLRIASSAAGDGLNYAAGVFSVDAGDGLVIGGSGELDIKIGPSNVGGLEFSLSNELQLANIGGAGLTYSAGEVSVNVDDSTIEIALDTLQIKDDGVTAAKINSDVAGLGLVQDIDGSLKVNVDDSTLEILSDVVLIKDDGVTAAKINADVAGDGLVQAIDGSLEINPGDGVQLLADAVAVKVSDLVGNGLEDDGLNNLRIKKEFSTISDISVTSSGLSIANRWGKESYTVVAADTVLTSNYYDLDFEIEPNSLVAFVDRLAIHEGASFDYTLSVVGGVTRVTFLNTLVTVGQQQLAAGDQLFFTYQKKAV